MYAYIAGKLVQREPTSVIIEVQGIGYLLKISLNTYAQLDNLENCKLHTYLHIREDAHTLYGFFDIEEKKLFLELISVSGIGANTALIMLSSLSTSELQQAIITENTRLIQGIKGIGLKTAQRVVLELKDKIKREGLETTPAAHTDKLSHTAKIKIRQEALQALILLGVPKQTAEKNIETIVKREGEDLSVEKLIKLALKI